MTSPAFLTVLRLLRLAPFLLLQGVMAQNCACGFRDSNGNIWRESIISTFTQSAGAIAALNEGIDWVIATDNEPQDTGIAIQYVDTNVMQFNDALGIRASAYTGDNTVNSGEIFTVVNSILYGTFRMRAQIPSTPGVTFGFFTYFNDTQESDIEFLTSLSDYYQEVWYTNQPGQLPNGDVDTAAAKDTVVPGADFTTFGEHRIDWLPNAVNYLYNSAQTASITKNVPSIGSEVVINVWSNGDPTWSQGPPTADAIATIQYVHLYFNSSRVSASSFAATCVAAGNIAPCSI